MELDRNELAVTYLGAAGFGGKDAALSFRYRMETARIPGVILQPAGNGIGYAPTAPETFGIHERYEKHLYQWARAFAFSEPTAIRLEVLGTIARKTGNEEEYWKDLEKSGVLNAGDEEKDDGTEAESGEPAASKA